MEKDNGQLPEPENNQEDIIKTENIITDKKEEAKLEEQSLKDKKAKDEKPKNKKLKLTKKKAIIIAIIAFLILSVGTVILISAFSSDPKKSSANITPDDQENIEEIEEVEKYDITIAGNGLDDFDLYFVKIEDDGSKNIVYSPLSIKYALNMLNEGTGGESKAQIEKVLGSYNFKKYQNSSNLALANAIFVNDSKKNAIKDTYITSLKDKFDAEVIPDSFATPDNINTWVSEKTFKLVENILNETDERNYFYLVNALAIDMDWETKFS